MLCDVPWWLLYVVVPPSLFVLCVQVRCWTILQGTLAPQAAGVIHTDFERGFIKAEVVSFDDFKR